MLMKSLPAIDRFYLILASTLVLLLFLLAFTLKGVFSAVKTAAEIDKSLTGPKIGVDLDKLNQAYKAVFEKQNISLDLAR